MWNVMLQGVESENDYTVESRLEDGQYIITITTSENFSLERMKGDKFKQEHVLDLPFSYFFPERLVNPRLAEGEAWDVALDENFILVYNAEFAPSSTYKIILDVE
jgi:zinc protease